MNDIDKLRKFSRLNAETGCVVWIGARSKEGYGRMSAKGTSGKRKVCQPHRVAFEIVNGEIPEGLTIDHLCRNPACVNTAHMEAVTNRENIMRGFSPTAINARKPHCPRGHAYTLRPVNRKGRQSNRRVCDVCARDGLRARRKRQRV